MNTAELKKSGVLLHQDAHRSMLIKALIRAGHTKDWYARELIRRQLVRESK